MSITRMKADCEAFLRSHEGEISDKRFNKIVRHLDHGAKKSDSKMYHANEAVKICANIAAFRGWDFGYEVA